MSTIHTYQAAAMTLLALALAAVDSATGFAAAPYPSKPIRLIAPSAPGSPPDVVARIVGEQLATAVGQPVVVDNRPGAIGTIGLQRVSKGTPDGYTLGIISMPYIIAPSLLPKLPFDVVKDFAPVTQIVWAYHILVVRASSPWKSVNDLIAFAKSRPGQVTFASGGNATPAHVSGVFLKLRSGIDIRHVPYKGAAAGITAVLGEQVDIMFAAATASAPHVRAGKLRALATPAPQRVPGFPDLPTMVELGFQGFEIREWHGVVAPARTPREIIARMSNELANAAAIPEAKERFAANGMDPVVPRGPEPFGALIRYELAKWGKIVREGGVRVD